MQNICLQKDVRFNTNLLTTVDSFLHYTGSSHTQNLSAKETFEPVLLPKKWNYAELQTHP
jgi:hypothetical protein